MDNFALNTEQQSPQYAPYEKEKREREEMKKDEIAMKQIKVEDHKRMAEYYNIMLCESPAIHQLMFPMATKR